MFSKLGIERNISMLKKVYKGSTVNITINNDILNIKSINNKSNSIFEVALRCICSNFEDSDYYTVLATILRTF